MTRKATAAVAIASALFGAGGALWWQLSRVGAANRGNHRQTDSGLELHKSLQSVAQQVPHPGEGAILHDENSEWYFGLTLADVHERDEFGLFVESHHATSNSLTRCSVAATSRTSQQDFENRIKPYITN